MKKLSLLFALCAAIGLQSQAQTVSQTEIFLTLVNNKFGVVKSNLDPRLLLTPDFEKWNLAVQSVQFPKVLKELGIYPIPAPILLKIAPDMLAGRISKPLALYVAALSRSPVLEPAVAQYIKRANELVSSTSRAIESDYLRAYSDACNSIATTDLAQGKTVLERQFDIQIVKIGDACLPIHFAIKNGPGAALAFQFPSGSVSRLVSKGERILPLPLAGQNSCNVNSTQKFSELFADLSLTKVQVAVIDSGVDYNHPAIRPSILMSQKNVSQLTKLRSMLNLNSLSVDKRLSIARILNEPQRLEGIGWDFLEDSNYPMDYFSNQSNSLGWMVGEGHGTHVAGLANGGSPFISILPIRMIGQPISKSGKVSQDQLKYEISYDALNLAAMRGARVANISMDGFDERGRGFSNAIVDNPDLLVTISAGNGGAEITSYSIASQSLITSHLIRVANFDASTQMLAAESNYSAEFVDVAAIGQNVESCVVGGHTGKLSGTSMSAPVVANLAATLIAIRPDLSAEIVSNLICDSADPLPTLKGKVRCGLINPRRAIEAVKQMSAPKSSSAKLH